MIIYIGYLANASLIDMNSLRPSNEGEIPINLQSDYLVYGGDATYGMRVEPVQRSK